MNSDSLSVATAFLAGVAASPLGDALGVDPSLFSGLGHSSVTGLSPRRDCLGERRGRLQTQQTRKRDASG